MGQRPSRVMQMQFHSECMEKYCRVLSRQVKDLIYIKNDSGCLLENGVEGGKSKTGESCSVYCSIPG